MSAANLTEEASKVRSSAASSMIQTEFLFMDLKRDFDSFKTEFDNPLARHSSSIEELANNEYTQVLEIKNRSENLLEKVKSDAILCSSAVSSSSSSLSPPSSPAVLSIMSDIEKVSVHLINTNSTLSEFSISGDFVEQWQILKTTLDNIDNALVGSNKIIDQILKLLFG